MANIMPSGNAGLITRIKITVTPMRAPYIHRPVLVPDPETGSVAINTRPNAKLPITKCQYQGTWNIGLVSDPTIFNIDDITIIPTKVPKIIL